MRSPRPRRPRPGPIPLRSPSRRCRLARLKDLVDANDGEAAEAVESLAQSLAGVVEAERLAALRAAIDAFDFDKASDLLSHIAQSCAVGA